jgi:hypothetical protein
MNGRNSGFIEFAYRGREFVRAVRHRHSQLLDCFLQDFYLLRLLAEQTLQLPDFLHRCG